MPASLSSGRSKNYSSSSFGYAIESEIAPANDNEQVIYVEDLMFRNLCPIDKVDSVSGKSDGIIKLLQNEIGVDVKILNPVASSEEQVIIISSDKIVGEITTAREALVEVTSRLRSYTYRKFFQRDIPLQVIPASSSTKVLLEQRKILL